MAKDKGRTKARKRKRDRTKPPVRAARELLHAMLQGVTEIDMAVVCEDEETMELFYDLVDMVQACEEALDYVESETEPMDAPDLDGMSEEEWRAWAEEKQREVDEGAVGRSTAHLSE